MTITGRGPHPKYPYMRRMGLESLPTTTHTLILGKYSHFMERLVLLVEVGPKCGEVCSVLKNGYNMYLQQQEYWVNELENPQNPVQLLL